MQYWLISENIGQKPFILQARLTLDNSAHKNLPAEWFIQVYPNANYAKYNFTDILHWNPRPKVSAKCIEGGHAPTYAPDTTPDAPTAPALPPTVQWGMSALQPIHTKAYADSEAPQQQQDKTVSPTPVSPTAAPQNTAQSDPLETEIASARKEAREAAVAAMAKAAQARKRANKVAPSKRKRKKGGHTGALIVLSVCVGSVLFLCAALGRMLYLSTVAIVAPEGADAEAAAVVKEVYGTGGTDADGYATIGEEQEQ